CRSMSWARHWPMASVRPHWPGSPMYRTKAMPDYRIAYRPFPQQQAYFRRKVNVPSARWDDLMHGEHAHGFMAAGVARADVLDDLRRAVQAAIDDGEGFDAFRARFDDILKRHGWIGGAGDE